MSILLGLKMAPLIRKVIGIGRSFFRRTGTWFDVLSSCFCESFEIYSSGI
jgi:hypothetical protein